MKIKEFRGYEDVYPEKIVGTDQWFYGQCTPCSEAYEVSGFNGNYPGTRLYLFNINGNIFEPVKQEKNVFLEKPAYNIDRESFGIVRNDFNKAIIQVIEYRIRSQETIVLTELLMSKAGDMINVRIITDPYMLVKHDIHNDAIDFLWPIERRYQFEENESLDFMYEDKLFTSKWIEDPDYREEVIIREKSTGEVIERKPGYMVTMPDGSRWIMTR